ncbi:hypothetical protein F5B20DRAFT_586892 [Whalleya microplaca]|nr:hypothetical protein F5B20DRAFT_586892 [Whalleya microplaca]
MLTQSLLPAALGAALALGKPHANHPLKRQDNTKAAGTNPIAHFSAEYLGQQRADNSCSHRDLGFTGVLGGKWYAVYGDTLWCDRGVADAALDSPGFHGMVRDALSLTTADPLVVHDLHLNADQPVPHQLQLVPWDAAWGEDITFGFGGTSLVETADGAGAVFYLVNANKDGLRGAGIAKVELVNGEPTVTKRFGSNGYWWPADKCARYGDTAAFRDPHSEYIYIWGGPPTYITDWLNSSYVYQARVKAADAYDLSKYEYWWGRSQGWKSTLLTEFTPETAVMWGTGQGQLVWNDFFKCYIFVHLGPGSGDVLLRTADSPQGPWTPDVKVYEATPIDGGMTYAGVAHPYLDQSGQTLTISYTNDNHIEVIKVTFSK